MALLALPPAAHLLIERRDRGQFVPSRRRRIMANVRAEYLPKIPAEPSPELRIPNAAAQTRMVSVAKIRLDSRKSVRSFKGIICVDISEFESHMPSHAVWSLWHVRLAEIRWKMARAATDPHLQLCSVDRWRSCSRLFSSIEYVRTDTLLTVRQARR
jgi:hypothetical protein